MIPSVSGLTPASSDEILRPVNPGFIVLMLLYWCIQEPRYVGIGTAWVVGLLMDVADATVFGQHALAYAVLAYAADYFRRRVLRFPLWQQAVQVAALLALCAALVLLVRVVGGAPVPRWTYLMSPVIGALLWPPISVLLQRPQRPTHGSHRTLNVRD
jgi:rod shape-determining protein MreD